MIIITKDKIKKLLEVYASKRSVRKAGLFSAMVDCCTTPFYYKLRNFYNKELKNYPNNTELLPEHKESLQTLIEENGVECSATNDAIVDLCESIQTLLRPTSFTAAARTRWEAAVVESQLLQNGM